MRLSHGNARYVANTRAKECASAQSLHCMPPRSTRHLPPAICLDLALSQSYERLSQRIETFYTTICTRIGPLITD